MCSTDIFLLFSAKEITKNLKIESFRFLKRKMKKKAKKKVLKSDKEGVSEDCKEKNLECDKEIGLKIG